MDLNAAIHINVQQAVTIDRNIVDHFASKCVESCVHRNKSDTPLKEPHLVVLGHKSYQAWQIFVAHNLLSVASPLAC